MTWPSNRGDIRPDVPTPVRRGLPRTVEPVEDARQNQSVRSEDDERVGPMDHGCPTGKSTSGEGGEPS